MSTRPNSRFPKRSARSKPKQTTLQFSPLASSSPVKENYSPAVQSRLASVRYRGAKPKPTPDEYDLPSTVEQSLPTPEPSSQVPYKDGEETLASAGQAHSTKIQQKEGIEDEDEDLISPAQKRRRISSGTPISTTLSTPVRRSTRLHPRSASVEELLGPATPSNSSPLGRRSTRLRQTQPRQSTRMTRSPSVQTLVSVEIPSPQRRRSSKLSDLGSIETSDDDDIVMASRPTARRRQPTAVHDLFIVDDEELQYVSDADPPKRRQPKSRKLESDRFVIDDSEIEYITSDQDEAMSQKRRKSEPYSAAKKARRAARRRKEVQDELDDDLQNLQDSEEEEPTATTRTRGGPVTTRRDEAKEHFELLKSRRAGAKIPRVYDSEDEAEDLSGLDLDLLGQPNDDEEGSVQLSVDTIPEEEQVYAQENEEDFIVDDTTERSSRPHSDLPLQFTSFASAKPRELFIHIIEWLVKNKIAPAFSREDELYNLAFAKIDDQVKAQAGSRLISAAWGINFKRAILARPEMKVSTLPGLDEDNMRTCDACNRTNHPARYEFMFSGQPYFKKTLEPVDESDNEEAERVDDDASHNEEGYALPDQRQRFYLGRYCAANAEMGHKLTHWKYHLNEDLMAYLEEQGVLSAESVVAREKMNKKKREREAENIVDSMQETDLIAEFWANFKNTLDDARLGMEDFEKKGGRSKGRIGAIRATANGTIRE